MGMYKYKGIKLWRGMHECTGKLSSLKCELIKYMNGVTLRQLVSVRPTI